MNKPVFTLTVMDDGDVINNTLPAFPVEDLIRLPLRQVADGFERGDARRVDT